MIAGRLKLPSALQGDGGPSMRPPIQPRPASPSTWIQLPARPTILNWLPLGAPPITLPCRPGSDLILTPGFCTNTTSSLGRAAGCCCSGAGGAGSAAATGAMLLALLLVLLLALLFGAGIAAGPCRAVGSAGGADGFGAAAIAEGAAGAGVAVG